MYYFNITSCPHCAMPIEVHVGGVCSCLGPSEIQCLRCGQPMVVQRAEWPEMTVAGRVWFGLMTVIYIAMLGLLTGNFLDAAYQLWNGDPEIINLRYTAVPFQVAAVIGGVAALVIQIVRVILSCLRSGKDYRLTWATFLFGLQWNLHFKCLFVLIAIWLVAKIKYSL